jgi:quinol monooxygenase YgiN
MAKDEAVAKAIAADDSSNSRRWRNTPMSEPVFFLSHFRIKEGALDRVRQLARDVSDQLHAEKPRTVLFLSYVDNDRGVISFLHAFPDEEAMDLHNVGSDERSKAAYEHVEPLGWEIYGRPSAAALETLRQAAASTGVPLALNAEYVAGFVRVGAN